MALVIRQGRSNYRTETRLHCSLEFLGAGSSLERREVRKVVFEVSKVLKLIRRGPNVTVKRHFFSLHFLGVCSSVQPKQYDPVSRPGRCAEYSQSCVLVSLLSAGESSGAPLIKRLSHYKYFTRRVYQLIHDFFFHFYFLSPP